MNEDEIDVSSSSSSSASSSRASSPVRNSFQVELLDPNDDQEMFDLGKMPLSVHQQIIKTDGEIDIDELPPVEPLDLKAPLEDLDQIGRVTSITGKLVIAVSFQGKSQLDIDSILFLRDCFPLGKIFDTFGPVTCPYYAVLFDSTEDITNRGVKINSPVYFVPTWSTPLTKYIFHQDLLKVKGSDASWKFDNEPSDDQIDFSDDEEERLFKLYKRLGKNKSNFS